MRTDRFVSTASIKSGDIRGSEGETRPQKSLVLRLETSAYNGAIVLHCQAQSILQSEVRALSRIISDVLPSSRRMVVDLAAVTWVDSGALGELVLTHMWAEAAGYELKFSNLTDPMWRLLEATNLASVLDVHSTTEEALKAMSHQEVDSA